MQAARNLLHDLTELLPGGEVARIDEATHVQAFVPGQIVGGAIDLAIEFRHPVWPSPQSMGMSDDARPLGFWFEFVALRRLERLHPDWKIIGIRRAAPARCLQSICISLKPPAHEGRFKSAENALK